MGRWTLKLYKQCRALLLAIIILLLSLIPGCSGKKEAAESVQAEIVTPEMVKAEFLHAWNAYKKYAWGHDVLLPLSKKPGDWYRDSFLMTPIDAFDTMLIMGLTDEARGVKELILSELSFDKDISVQNFEFTIRILGGLLSAYQMDGDPEFLKLAQDLGDRLLPAYDSPTGMPYRFVNLKTGETRDALSNPAEIGSLLLEMGMLSELTGDLKYYKAAKKALVALYSRRSNLDLIGTTINIETGEWDDKRSHISAKVDSYYEYLLKGWLLFGDKDCKEMWETSIAAVNKYLTDELETGFWYGHSEMEIGSKPTHNFGALDAFFPAVLALSGDVERAAKLQQSCFKMWTTYGLEPEQIDTETMEIKSGSYVLRPENIESAYYLYQYTFDPKYREMGVTYFNSLVHYCKIDEGYAALGSVVDKTKIDNLESFFFAETLKYLYLLFAEEGVFEFEDYIFNTEAHPYLKSSVKNKRD